MQGGIVRIMLNSNWKIEEEEMKKKKINKHFKKWKAQKLCDREIL